jgi:uncharacterized membrane protein YccC
VFGLWLVTQPASAGVGPAFMIFFTTLVSPQNPPTHDPTFLFNQGFALIIGMAIGSITFGVLLPAEGLDRLARLQRSFRRQLERACHAPLPGLRQRFQSQCRDLLLQIQATTGVDAARLGDTQNYGLSVLDAGHAIVEARNAVAGDAALSTWHKPLQAMLDAIVELCDRPERTSRNTAQQRIAALIAALDAACAQNPASLPALRRVIAALHRVRGGLLDLARDTVAENLPTGAAHAA